VRESEEKYHALFDSIDQGFCVIEVLFDDADNVRDYRFLEVNRVFEKQTGISNAVGRRMREIAPAHEEHWFQIYGQIALTGESRRFENPAQALGRFYDVYAFRVGRPDQRHVAILFNDITERKQAEEALTQSAEESTTSITTRPCGYHSLDTNGFFVRINDTEMLRTSPQNCAKPLRPPAMWSAGSPRSRTSPAQAHRGRTQGWQRIPRRHHRIHPLVLFIKDGRSLRYLRLNRAGEDLLGWPKETFIGKSDYELSPQTQAESFVEKDREALKTGGLFEYRKNRDKRAIKAFA
jgi:PAS domain S-box-containing protein